MQGTAGTLANMAAGNGPSAAQDQLRQATDQALQQQAGAVASTKGLNPAMAAQMAAQNGAATMQGAANQSAQLRANQQLAAIGALQGQQANLGALAGQQVGQQQNQQNQNAANVLNQLQSQNTNAVNMQNGINSANSGIAQQNAKNQGEMFSGAVKAGGQGLAMLSDERQKKDIHPADSKIEDMLSKAGAHEYSYKDPSMAGAGAGKHVSPMAQELEQSELGSQMVMDTPQGKMVDYGKGMGTMMSALSELHKRIKELEGSKKPIKKSAGGHIPGKATVTGDSEKNDTVPAMLSPGEIVIPRSVLSTEDPVSAAAKFVQAILAKQSMKPSKSK